MTILQTEFNKFNDAIRLGWDNEEARLRERRDAVIDRIRERMGGPSFSHFNQGSYELRTGVKPVNGDYDIDVGLRFNTTRSEWPDPVALKQRVVDALSGYKVELRRPCVTVYYQRRNEPLYHVDLNVYVPAETEGMLHLAVGKVGDAAPLKEWRFTDPLALGAALDTTFAADDREQCRRVIRYLKRWKDSNFPAQGNAAPKGIGLTAAALQWFTPARERDGVANRVHHDDLKALSGLVWAMLAHATPRLVVKLPVPPHDDLFRRMSEQEMSIFVAKLGELDEGLRRALADADEGSASRTLREFFGEDFPAVTSSPTARRIGAIVSSGSAG
ncbi:hypothetical protein SAMN02745121_04364 [Nannocystis exedens]|uniref:Cyclic GMP-AMP synthase n=1 Tax=Nannocystis exedens TaxID=54 RepID=A0A1I2ATK2_9BACT|nr:nucleotidyltransferase [Nannocystis exedens]PCC74261.1 hypothetical protein NAEX_07350 [Nannocystis exedens]SFE47156.1 hypothetical protein SAMN02745121_04364 [Nannocystis exedens]